MKGGKLFFCASVVENGLAKKSLPRRTGIWPVVLIVSLYAGEAAGRAERKTLREREKKGANSESLAGRSVSLSINDPVPRSRGRGRPFSSRGRMYNEKKRRFLKRKVLKLERGYLIVFEGIDGTGKSTHCRLLADYLESRGLSTARLSEPTRGAWGTKIRKILAEGRNGISPEEELILFVNDRKEDVERNIKPALEQKKAVLIDRYYYSTAAYQGALGLDPEKICRENESFAPRPDLVFIFEASPEECLRRIRESRNAGPNAFEQLEYLKKVQSIFRSFSGPQFRRVDSKPAKETVHAQLRREMDDLFRL